MKIKTLFLFLLYSSCYQLPTVCAQDKVKMYAVYTPTHQVFVENWFLPSIKDDYEVILEKHEQLSESGAYGKEGWRETMMFKVDVVIRGIKENWNKVFVHSDVDIQFFKRTKDIILALMRDKDMMIQLNNARNGEMCAGFFACRGNQKNLDLWVEIKKRLSDKNNKTHDQAELNKLVKKDNVYNLQWDYLPLEFYCPRGGWSPGKTLDLPENIVMHHANWTIGISNKLVQLDYVRKNVYKALYGVNNKNSNNRSVDDTCCSMPEEMALESGLCY